VLSFDVAERLPAQKNSSPTPSNRTAMCWNNSLSNDRPARNKARFFKFGTRHRSVEQAITNDARRNHEVKGIREGLLRTLN